MIFINLIINADDFGLSKAVNLGIIEAFRHGIVTSATIMAGMPAFDHAVHLANKNPELKIGVHLTLTMGQSVQPGHRTITDEKGYFHKQAVFFDAIDNIDHDEVEAEYTAQIEKVLNAGLKITHIDGHHHTHALPVFWSIVKRLCKKYNLAARCVNNEQRSSFIADNIKTTDEFSSGFYGEYATRERLTGIIKTCSSDSLEIMCHPAYVDKALYEATGYNIKRIFELDILTAENIKDFIRENKITLCGFDKLK